MAKIVRFVCAFRQRSDFLKNLVYMINEFPGEAKTVFKSKFETKNLFCDSKMSVLV